jgi:Holliday junction DNA helicase RuvB
LMQGGAGLGKTECAHILANEMGMEDGPYEQLAQNIKSPADLHAFLLEPKDKEVALLDEIHELPPVAQTTLYRAMENQQIFLESRKGRKNRPIQIADYTIIGCTTDPQKLLQPLRDRFKLVLDFQFYEPEELELLVKNRTQALNWDVEENVCSEISLRGKGTPRLALRLLESTRMTALSENATVITMKHFETTCALESIDAIGLTENENKYLKVLYENECNCRLNVIASRLGLHPKHVSEIIESYLIREGLVTKENSCRVLTASGLEHIRNNQDEVNQ